jgi:two-component system, LuxR family, sensor kinase FixL
MAAMKDLINSDVFKTMIENLPDAIIVTNERGIITAANKEVFKVFGYEPEELIGKEVEILIPRMSREINRDQVKNYFKNPQRLRIGVDRTIIGLRKDGSEFEADVSLSPVKVGNEYFSISSTRDITKNKDGQEKLIEENKNLEKINKDLKEYGYTISHDLKAPLQRIGSLTNILLEEIKDGKDPEELKDVSGYIQSSISSAEKIIGDTLDDAKKENEILDEMINMEELFHEIENLISIPQNFKFKVNCKFIAIPGKRVKLLQVLMNLLTNAVKYNDKPLGRINLTCKESGKNYLFTVADNGKGIPAEKLHKIFDLFEKDPDITVSSHGVGLSTVKSIIESRGGKITVTSKEGLGTKVKFTWPKVGK